MEKNTIDWIALVLLIIGGLNWGLVAIDPAYDLVAMIANATSAVIGTIVYALVGLSALYTIYYLFKE